MFSGVAFWQLAEAPVVPGLTYGRWVGVRATGTNLRAAWSNDGISWNTATTPNSSNYRSVDFSPELGLYVGVAEISSTTAGIMSSTNGVTWTARTKPITNTTAGIRWCSAFGLFIVNTYQNILTSADAITWVVAHTYSVGVTWASDAYQSMYYNTADQGPLWATTLVKEFGQGTSNLKVVWTTNGTTFTENDTTTDTFWADGDGRAIVYSTKQSRYMIVGQSNASRILISSTISSGWSFYTQSVPGSAFRYGLAAVDVFVSPIWNAVTTAGSAYSTLGTNGSWTSSVMPSQSHQYRCIGYSSELNQFFIPNSNSTRSYTSTDGITWTMRTTVNEIHSVVFGPGVRTTGYKQGAGIT